MTFKRNVNGFLEVIFRMFLLISAFTSIDIIYHTLYEKNFNLYVVPLSYYLNKIIVGFFLGVLAYYIINYWLKWTKYSYKKISAFSLFIVVILQLRYITTGHFTLFQNFVVGFAHYIILMGILSVYYKVYGMDYLG